MYSVQISARIITWPRICACCCQAADTTAQITSTRTTGVEVIHKQTKGWSVPYCRRCLDHIDAAADLRAHSTFVFHLSILFSFLGGVLALVALAALAKINLAVAIVLALMLVVVTVMVVALTFGWCQERYRGALQEKLAEEARLERRLDSLLSPGCAQHESLAASYDGWQGSVHTFRFANADFATALENANPGKCLGRLHH